MTKKKDAGPTLDNLGTAVPGTTEEHPGAAPPEAPEPGQDIQTVETKENLKCHLTDEEIRKYAREAARANGDIKEYEDDLAAVKAEYKSRIDRAQAIDRTSAGHHVHPFPMLSRPLGACFPEWPVKEYLQ